MPNAEQLRNSPIPPKRETIYKRVILAADAVGISAVAHGLYSADYQQAIISGVIFSGLVTAQKVAGNYRKAYKENPR